MIPFRMSPRVVSSRRPVITPLELAMNAGGPVVIKCGSTTTLLGSGGISSSRAG